MATITRQDSKHTQTGRNHRAIEDQAEAGRAELKAIKAIAGTAATTTRVTTAVETARTEGTNEGTHEESGAVAGKAKAEITSKAQFVDTIIVWRAWSCEQDYGRCRD